MGAGERRFSGSEELARSLEPGYAGEESSSHESQEPVARRAPRRRPQRRLREPHPHRRKRFEVFAAAYMGVLLLLVFVLSVATDSSPFVVFLGFLPTLFTVIIAMVVYESSIDNKHVLWVIPLVLIFAFWWLGSERGLVGSVDVDALTGLNVLFSFLYLVINYFLLQSAPAAAPRVVVRERVVEKEVVPEDLSRFIASIEDKGKALNFVIGRVYNSYHGGSRELRQRINMKQEWYDQFSQLPEDPREVDFVELSSLISTIESRLRLLERPEVEVFGADHRSFKHLVRDEQGKDRVIDVLDKNDKDPVKSYVEGALQFCGKVKDYIRKRQAPGVKNEYVPREDEGKKAAPRSSSWVPGGRLRKR